MRPAAHVTRGWADLIGRVQATDRGDALVIRQKPPEMATRSIKRRVGEDESGGAADRCLPSRDYPTSLTERGTASEKSPPVVPLTPLPSDEHLDTEESGLAAAGLLRLPAEGLADSVWRMPAPHASFADAVTAVASERDEG